MAFGHGRRKSTAQVEWVTLMMMPAVAAWFGSVESSAVGAGAWFALSSPGVRLGGGEVRLR